MIKVFMGYDEREAVAYHTASQSIIENTTGPVYIYPLRTDKLRRAGVYNRPDDQRASNAFSYTRFLVPYLSDYAGISIYMDPDVIVKGDLSELIHKCNEVLIPVFVVKHEYTPKRQTKYFGAKQHNYPRKNWSSVMVFQNAACQYQLTPENVNNKSAEWLHRFQWVVGYREVGELDKEWNWLVDEYDHNDDAKILHYTNGIPAIDGFADCDHADDWWYYYNRSTRARK